jgi:hypothetical protein
MPNHAHCSKKRIQALADDALREIDEMTEIKTTKKLKLDLKKVKRDLKLIASDNHKCL